MPQPEPSRPNVDVAATLALARLVIHMSEAVTDEGGKVYAALRRFGARAMGFTHDDPPGRVLLQIADLQGRPFFTASEFQRLTEVPLPAGIYCLTVNDGVQTRRYTVALEQGARLDLHLRGAPAAR